MVEIKRNREYFDVYIDGKFYCTADNEREANQEADDYLSERGNEYETKSS